MNSFAVTPISPAVRRLVASSPYWRRSLSRVNSQAGVASASRAIVRVPVDRGRGSRVDVLI